MFRQVLKTNGHLCLGTSACLVVPFYSHHGLCQRSRTTNQRLNKTEALGKQTSVCWALSERVTVCWKIFFFPFKEHFSLRITSHLAGLTYILTLEVIRANHWSWEGGFLHLNKAIHVPQSVNPWKALRFHSLTCLINMEIVKMFWLVKIFSAFLKLALAPTCTKCWLGMPRSLHHLLYCVHIDNPWSINKSHSTKKCLFCALKGTLLSQGNKSMAKGGKRVCTKKMWQKGKNSLLNDCKIEDH